MTNEALHLNESELKHELVFDCSIEKEIDRVRNVVSRLAWYKENGYTIQLPNIVMEKLRLNQEVTEEDVAAGVSEEFKDNNHAEQLVLIEEEWKSIADTFFANLETLGLPIESEYKIFFTAYGTGGSYHTPDTVVINWNRGTYACMTLAHEIVHLTIEPLIKKYGIEHWTKERLVNLVINKFFPDKHTMQRDPQNAEQIGDIFEREFPNIEKIISEISKY